MCLRFTVLPLALLLAIPPVLRAASDYTSYRNFAESNAPELYQPQSPVGVWQGTMEDGQVVLLAFDGGPREGVYRQLTTAGSSKVRELGHWSVNGSELRMLIMASDVPDHPRFGVDTAYYLAHTGPTEIIINGPDRPNLKLHKAPAGTEVPIEPFTP